MHTGIWMCFRRTFHSIGGVFYVAYDDKKTTLECLLRRFCVELERFELSSIRGIFLLSTCLASLVLSG